MKNCAILTSEYPYFGGEPFLANEIPYLSHYFDNIYIFTINASSRDRITREVPNNVFVYPLDTVVSKYKYLYYGLRGIFLKDSSVKITEKQMGRVLASLYIRGRAKCVADAIRNIVVAENLNMRGAILYSFWFSYQAIAAMLLKNELESLGCSTCAFSRAHGYDLYWERSKVKFQPFQDVLLKNLCAVLPCSNQGKEYLIQKFSWAEPKIIVSRLGTRDYGVADFSGEKVFVTCSHIISIKRLDLFAKAFCIAAENDSDLEWICIGDGDQLSTIKRIVLDAKKEERVRFVGALRNDEVMSLYRNTSVMYFCNVSSSEGLPVSIMEALSFGIPIIGIDVGGVKELVGSDDGYLLPKSINTKQLADIIVEASALSSVEYNAKRKRAREKWEQKASANVNYEKFIEILEKTN